MEILQQVIAGMFGGLVVMALWRVAIKLFKRG